LAIAVKLTSAAAQDIVRKSLRSCVVEDVEPCYNDKISTVYEIRCATPDQHLILKVYPESSHWKMEKKVYVYGLLDRLEDLPIPSVLLWDDSKQLVPQNYLLMSKLQGQPLSHLTALLSDEQLRDIYHQMGRILARIHKATFTVFGYITIGVIDSHLTNAAYMRFQFDKTLKEFTKFGGEPSLHRAIADYVEAQDRVLSECRIPVLCHDDYHEGNVLIVEKKGHWRVSGIVDVENAVSGDPLLDIAKTDYYAIRGNAAKLEGFIEGYGPLPGNWRDRMQIFRLYHALELWDWCTSSGNMAVLAGIADDLRRFCAE
jgi:hygromycin-B 7''-O-kinase